MYHTRMRLCISCIYRLVNGSTMVLNVWPHEFDQENVNKFIAIDSTFAKDYCTTNYHGIANIYDPEGRGEQAVIGYCQDQGVNDWEWKWVSGVAYRNSSDFRWADGAKVDVFSDPWWQSSWNSITKATLDGYSAGSNEKCTAIVADSNGDYIWDLVGCDAELNILCDSGDDHAQAAQCWMLQSCSECAIR
eukprot:20711_1